jgi:hypothetical protein
MGGAIFNETGTILITNSTFSSNSARGGAPGLGGGRASPGIGLGGGLFNHNGSITVTNSTFSGNTATHGRNSFNLGDSTFATTASTRGVASIESTTFTMDGFTGKTSGAGTVNSRFVARASGDAEAQALFKAVNALAPQVPPVTVQINLAAGTYSDIVLKPPAGVTVIVKGAGKDTTIVGHSPALTVTGGGEVEVDDVTLMTNTDSPTVLLTGGTLKLRDEVIVETPGFNDPAVRVTGGLLDLGTPDDPGNNELQGQGYFLWATDPSEITVGGDLFDVNGVAQTGSEPTTTTVTTLTDTIVQGQGVQLTATVTAWNVGTPTGIVDFFDMTANADLGRVPLKLIDGILEAVFTTSELSAGSHEIRAVYLGDGTFIPSEDVIEATVISTDTPAIAKAEAYVNALYQQLLSRDVDPSGSTFWVGMLTQGASRQQVSLGILESDEGRLRQINDLYYTVLGRTGDEAGVQANLQYLKQGGSLEVLRTVFLSSDELMARSGGTPEAYLAELYHIILGRSSQGDDGASSFASFIQQGGDRVGVVHAILNSREACERLASQLYATILERNAEMGGLAYWSNQLQQSSGGEEKAIVGFLASDEFFNRS